jgi:hypothetical protein
VDSDLALHHYSTFRREVSRLVGIHILVFVGRIPRRDKRFRQLNMLIFGVRQSIAYSYRVSGLHRAVSADRPEAGQLNSIGASGV